MSLKCKECGKTLKQSPTNKGRAQDEAMGIYTRLRHCECGFKTVTAEMDLAELQDLRRRAFLYELSEARA